MKKDKNRTELGRRIVVYHYFGESDETIKITRLCYIKGKRYIVTKTEDRYFNEPNMWYNSVTVTKYDNEKNVSLSIPTVDGKRCYEYHK